MELIRCGSQCLICDYPVRIDTYSGCSHRCEYCFAANRKNLNEIKPLNCAKQLKDFIKGKRTSETRFIDWDIPLHFGGTSDPFQAAEKEHKRTLECLEIFVESKYPFIISTKNPVMAAEKPYIDLLHQCNVVLQVSMACPEYDKMESGAPTFEERLQAIRVLSRKVTRVIARIQPYMIEYRDDIIKQLPRMRDAGIYGVIVEGYVSNRKRDNMQRYGSKYFYDYHILFEHFKQIKDVCHSVGLRFFCGEDCLRWLGDDLTCCGTENLSGFKPLTYNVEHLAFGKAECTKAMTEQDGHQPFKSLRMTSEFANTIKGKNFKELIHKFGDTNIEDYKNIRSELDVH